MYQQSESVRTVTSFIAMGTVAALAGCGEFGDAAHHGGPHSEDIAVPRGAPPGGPFSTTTGDSDADVATVAGYRNVFDSHGLALDAIRFGAPVPRLFATRLPADMATVQDIDLRQSVFIATLLPIILDVNTAIRLERARILAVVDRVAAGEPVHDFDRRWIDRVALRYGTDDLNELLRRVDEIPPSLAIAQAAIETGWGTSRFAQDGNALYGQRIVRGKGGLRPNGYDTDPGFRVAAFTDLMASVESYALNLNTHPAYSNFRMRRARQRDAAEGGNAALDGHALAATLHSYSARGWDYVVIARSVISDNRLGPMDSARLRPIPSSPEPEMAESSALSP